MVFSGVWSEPWKMSAGKVSAVEPPRPAHPAPASSAAAEARKSRRVRTTALCQAASLCRFGHQAQLPRAGLRVFERAAALTADKRVWHRHRRGGIDQPAHGATADRADRRTGGTRRSGQRRQYDLLERRAEGLVECQRRGHSLRSTARTVPRIVTWSGYIGSISSFSGCRRTRPDSRKKRLTVASSSPIRATTISPLRASCCLRTTTKSPSRMPALIML